MNHRHRMSIYRSTSILLLSLLLIGVLSAEALPRASSQADSTQIQSGRLDYDFIRMDPAGETYSGLSLADMNYDGRPEILIGNYATGSLEIWEYDSEDLFANRLVTIPVGSDVHDVKAADFDDDGDMDLAIGLRFSGLYLATNTGSPGSVGSWIVESIDSDYSWQVLVADIDDDGHLDIAHGVDGGPIHMLYGDGNGDFADGVEVADPDSEMRFPRGFDAIDLDGDGLLDLIGVDGSFMRAFLNPGDRTSDWQSTGPDTPEGDYPCCDTYELQANISPSAADLDADGYVDQVAFLGTPGERGSVDLLLFKGGKDGADLTWTKTVLDTIDGPGWAGHAGIADLDGDGHLDIHVGGGSYFDGLRAYLGDGQGNFDLEYVPLDYGLGGLNRFAVGDLNGDGAADIVSSHSLSNLQQASGFEILMSIDRKSAGGSWNFACVDCPPDMIGYYALTGSSLQIDAEGNPHVAYVGSYLYYARHDGQTWQTQVVDHARTDGYPSLVLDDAGRAHISYQSFEQGSIRYASQTDNGWKIETVVLGAGYGETSLAIDSQGRPHIAYLSRPSPFESSYAVKYAQKDASGWTTETVAAANAGGPSLALDAGDRPHISLAIDGILNYATRTADGWEMVTVYSEVAGATSLAMDSFNRPHIAFEQDGAIMYALDDGNWQIETVSDNGDLHAPSLALAASGAPHVAYRQLHDDYDTNIFHASRDMDEWSSASVNYFDDYLDTAVALAVDSADTAHLVYVTGYGGDLLYQQGAGTSWSSEEVVAEGGYLTGASLALDSQSQASISYYDLRRQDLRFAQQGGDGWTIETVDSLGDVGFRSVVDVDGDGMAHIAYLAEHSSQQVGLKYARQVAGGWQRETVASDVGSYLISLAASADGQPHILYRTSGGDERKLIYAYKTSAGWQMETLATGRNNGIEASLAVDLDGRPHVAYVNRLASQDRLVYGYRDSAGWQTEIVDATAEQSGDIFEEPSLALGRDGAPYVVYARYDGRWIYVEYAHRDATGWHQETAGRYSEPPETGGLLPVLALGPDDKPHIAYNDVFYWYSIRYGVRDETGWHFHTVYDWGAGSTPELAVGRDGLPVMVNTNGHGVRIAKLEGEPARESVLLPVVLTR